MKTIISKYSAIVSMGFFAVLEKSIQFLAPCLIAVLVDIWTAYLLGRRVHKKHPKKADGKFKSEFKNRVLYTLITFFSCILLAGYVDLLIFRSLDADIAIRFVTGIFLGYEAWSILENASSCNGAKWAKVLQKIMVDKAERHFNIDIKEELK